MSQGFVCLLSHCFDSCFWLFRWPWIAFLWDTRNTPGLLNQFRYKLPYMFLLITSQKLQKSPLFIKRTFQKAPVRANFGAKINVIWLHCLARFSARSVTNRPINVRHSFHQPIRGLSLPEILPESCSESNVHWLTWKALLQHTVSSQTKKGKGPSYYLEIWRNIFPRCRIEKQWSRMLTCLKKCSRML